MPVYLYVKQHNITGLKYFGKTARNIDPYKYKGSGVHWLRHLKKHGSDIATLNVWQFENQDECTQFALDYSKQHNIVESKEWANLAFENGLDGRPIGITRSEDTIKKWKESFAGFKHSEEHKTYISKVSTQWFKDHPEFSEQARQRVIARNTGSKHSDETRAKMSKALKGRVLSEEHKAKLKIARHQRELRKQNKSL